MQAVIARVEACEPKLRALYAFEPERRCARRAIRGALAARRGACPRGRAGDHQGEHRDPRHAGAARHGRPAAAARRRGCAAGGAPARGRRHHLRQDDDAGLRHALVGPVELPPAHPQSVGPRRRIRAAARPAPARRRRPATGRCMSAPISAARSACRPAGAAIFGLKPSLGRVPIDPPYYGRVAGPMTRSVADAALMMRSCRRPDARDAHEPAAAGPGLARSRYRRAGACASG